MRRRWLGWSCGLWIVLWTGCAGSSLQQLPDPGPNAELFLWKVTGRARSAGHELALLGSIHVNRKDGLRFDAAILDAYDRADTLAVEIDLESIDGGRIPDAFVRHGLYPEGTRLQNKLSSDLVLKLKRALARSPLTFEQVDRFRPWMVLFVLPGAATTLELSTETGIDRYFRARARGSKPIISLETVEQQVTALASGSDALQLRMLEQALNDPEIEHRRLVQLIDAYHRGDTRRIEDLIRISSHASSDSDAQAYQERMFTKRNRTMAASIEKLLIDRRRVFAVVGVGHLLGDGSIVDLLRRKGYRVERQQATGRIVQGAIVPQPMAIAQTKAFGCTIRFPGSPTRSKQATPHGSADVLQSVADGVVYLLTTAPAPEALSSVKSYYEGFVRGMEHQGFLGRADTPEEILVGELPARLVTFRSEAQWARVLFVYSGGKVYAAMAIVKTTSGPSAQQRAAIDATLRTLELPVTDTPRAKTTRPRRTQP